MEYYAPFKKRCRALHYILHSGIQDSFLGKKKKKGASWRKVCIIYCYSSKKSGKEITVSQKVGKKKKSCLEWSGGKGEEEKENSEHIFPYIFDTNM